QPAPYTEPSTLSLHDALPIYANAMWQADHTPLDVLLLDETGKPAKPWLTAIEDDYSRAIVGYRLSFQEATTLTTALTLRTAIWRDRKSTRLNSSHRTISYAVF